MLGVFFRLKRTRNTSSPWDFSRSFKCSKQVLLLHFIYSSYNVSSSASIQIIDPLWTVVWWYCSLVRQSIHFFTITLQIKPAHIVQTSRNRRDTIQEALSGRDYFLSCFHSLDRIWHQWQLCSWISLQSIFSIFHMAWIQVLTTDLKSLFWVCSRAADKPNGFCSLRKGLWWITGHTYLIFICNDKI